MASNMAVVKNTADHCSDTHDVNIQLDDFPLLSQSISEGKVQRICAIICCRIAQVASVWHQPFVGFNRHHRHRLRPSLNLCPRCGFSEFSHFQTSYTSHLLRRLLQMLMLASLCTKVYSEEASDYDDDDNEDFIVTEESSPACVLLFSLMFGFFITMFCAVVGYFAYVEDSLMRTYIKDGELIQGNVMTAEFARGGGQVGPCSNQRTIAEYVTFVEYTRELSTNYEVRVRKQMKAKETDFAKPLLPGSSAMLKSLKYQMEGDNIAEGGCSEDIDCDGYVEIGLVHQSSALGRPGTIELYVLPDYPRSALPRRQVERGCSYRHRLATFGLIVVVLALALLCARVAAEALVDMSVSESGRIDSDAILLFTALVLVQLPIVHCGMRGLFWNIIREEYLESGEYVTIHHDDSTLSTTFSDAYLRTSLSASASVGLDLSAHTK